MLYLRWTELLSSGGTHQRLSSPTLDRTDGSGWFIVLLILVAIVRIAVVGIAVIIIVVIIVLVVIVCWGSVTELLSHPLAARHAEALAAPAHRNRIVLLVIGIDLVGIGWIVVREPALDVGLQYGVDVVKDNDNNDDNDDGFCCVALHFIRHRLCGKQEKVNVRKTNRV